MPRFGLRTLAVVVALVSILLLFAKYAYDFSQRLTAEYTTADVIREVTQYVETHGGQWPRGWDDLPNGDRARRYVMMKFDVSIDELIDDPALVQSTIVPITGGYRTYPHAERQLRDLRDVLARFHGGRGGELEGAGDF